jgi:hypothetical protein
MMASFSTAAANAMLDALEAAIGPSPTLIIYDAAQPSDTSTADVGNVLATMVLPTDWMAAASGRTKALSGLWRDAAADAAGQPAGFAIKQGATVWLRGTASATGGGGELRFNRTPFSVGQQVDVISFQLSL